MRVEHTFASSHRVHFNPAKTQLICFGTAVNCSCSDTFIFCGRRLAMLDSVVHLGSYLTVNLSDDLDISDENYGLHQAGKCCALTISFC